MEEQEDARRELIAKRKKASAQKIKDSFEALKNQQELLRENWKIHETNAQEKTAALNHSVRDLITKLSEGNKQDVQKIVEQYRDLEQQRKILMADRLKSQQELLEGFFHMNAQSKNFMDELLRGSDNQEFLKERRRIENQRENLGLIWQALTESSRARSAELDAQLKTMLENISSGAESNPQKNRQRLEDLEHQKNAMLENVQTSEGRVMDSAQAWNGQLSGLMNQLSAESSQSAKESQQSAQEQIVQFENHFKNSLDPRDLRNMQAEAARAIEEQRARAIERAHIQQDRQQDLKSFTDEQMRNTRDKIQDRANGL